MVLNGPKGSLGPWGQGQNGPIVIWAWALFLAHGPHAALSRVDVLAQEYLPQGLPQEVAEAPAHLPAMSRGPAEHAWAHKNGSGMARPRTKCGPGAWPLVETQARGQAQMHLGPVAHIAHIGP